jgi:hypothetical protein
LNWADTHNLWTGSFGVFRVASIDLFGFVQNMKFLVPLSVIGGALPLVRRRLDG